MTHENIQLDLLLQKVHIITDAASLQDVVNELSAAINHFIINDFERLIQWLYRIDVNEKTLKQLLAADKETDAAVIIAHLIIKRQQEKQQTKMRFKKNTDIPDEDKW